MRHVHVCHQGELGTGPAAFRKKTLYANTALKATLTKSYMSASKPSHLGTYSFENAKRSFCTSIKFQIAIFTEPGSTGRAFAEVQTAEPEQ